jgi:adenosine deaminase CECR1
MVMTPHEATHVRSADGTERHVPLGNVFDEDYIPNTWMSYKQFQEQFEFVDEHNHVLKDTPGAELWLERKMQISEEEAHATYQTGRG